MKYFYRNIWHLGENWENTVYVFGVLDSDEKVEQDERELAASCSISDDEQGMEEEEEVGERLSLSLHRYQHDVQASPRRARRAGR